MSLNLRLLSDEEFERAARLAKASGIPLSVCPTCDDSGLFRFRGEEHVCDCATQMALRKHYLLAGIGDQYQRLNWETDFHGSPEVKNSVAAYLAKWDSFHKNGMGIEFSGKKLATGKTFSATYVGRELIKRGVRVQFIPYNELLNLHNLRDSEAIMNRLKESTVLILDEVTAPFTEAQRAFYADRIEDLIRHRTNFNLPIIMTTNLTEDELHENYPRVYSLLEAKQWRVNVDGEDARINKIGLENIELAQAGEIRPIC